MVTDRYVVCGGWQQNVCSPQISWQLLECKPWEQKYNTVKNHKTVLPIKRCNCWLQSEGYINKLHCGNCCHYNQQQWGFKWKAVFFEWFPPWNTILTWYQSFWHTIWKCIYQYMAYSCCHSIWHFFLHIHWHSIWHSIWHLYIEMFSGIYSDILSCILSGIFLTFSLTFFLAFYLASILTSFLSGILSDIPFGVWLRSGCAHWDLELAGRGAGRGGGSNSDKISRPSPGRWGTRHLMGIPANSKGPVLWHVLKWVFIQLRQCFNPCLVIWHRYECLLIIQIYRWLSHDIVIFIPILYPWFAIIHCTHYFPMIFGMIYPSGSHNPQLPSASGSRQENAELQRQHKTEELRATMWPGSSGHRGVNGRVFFCSLF